VAFLSFRNRSRSVSGAPKQNISTSGSMHGISVFSLLEVLVRLGSGGDVAPCRILSTKPNFTQVKLAWFWPCGRAGTPPVRLMVS
jgi:hypothetical protein